MPVYTFECHKCEYRISEAGSMSDPPVETGRTCPCGSPMYRAFSRTQTFVFKPYVEDSFDGNPIEVGSRREREILCDQHEATYDSGRYVRRPKYESVMDDITLDDVYKEYDRRGPQPLDESGAVVIEPDSLSGGS